MVDTGRLTPDRCSRTAEITYGSCARVAELHGTPPPKLQLEWSRIADVLGRQLEVGMTLESQVPGSPVQGIKEVCLSTPILELCDRLSFAGKCSHIFGQRATALDLSISTAGGAWIGLACDDVNGLSEISAFHTAGPVNIQPRWLTKAHLLRLHVGRGSAFRRCPLSMQVDIPLSAGSRRPELELKVRRDLGLGRRLRGVWMATQGSVLCEYQDSLIEDGAVWLAHARCLHPF